MSKTDIKIMGDGFISEGEYGTIKVMGRAQSEGNVKAEIIKDMGDARFNGQTEFGTLKVMGTMKQTGDLVSQYTKVLGNLEVTGSSEIEELVINGEMVLNGDLKCNNVTVNGRLTVKGNLYAKDIKIYGEMKTEGNIESEEAAIEGMIQCKGLFNAENISISPRANCFCKEIGASRVSIRKPKYNLLASLFISGGYGKVESELIEADEIELECVNAKEVKGHNIQLIDDCKINHVEYSGTFTMSESCEVERQTKRG